MAEVTFDDSSYLVDGKRVWLVSGSVHYFRVPAELWRDRLLKAKRAGLNCITTYAAWNVHEPKEGQWEFSGDADIAEFVRIAGELGLYVILRPGPYICAEWDFGGLPGWLMAKGGMAFRTSNAAYMHFFDKYFRQLLGRLADLQVTRGGNIILIQNENEYQMTTMPDRLTYLEFISQLFRRAGFEIPIITCNYCTDPPVPETVECINGWDNVVQQLKKLSARQPGAPLLVTEFWDGWFDQWGGEHQTRDARETARRAMEILGCGAQYNYYMWHGGTNFGFYGSRLGGSEAAYQTTSYDYDAPVAEGGGMTEKYYLTRLVNMLAAHMGPFWASAFMEAPGVSIHDNTCVMNIAGSRGRWAVVTNNGNDAIETARISLPSGRELDVSLAPLGAAAVPVDMQIAEEATLDYTNLTPLGLFGENVLVLHGPAGWAGRVSVNGREICEDVPAGADPKVVEHEGLHVVLVNSELAMRTWFVDETLVFGPRFVGEDLEQVATDPKAKQYALLSLEGKLTHKKVKTDAAKKPATPKLGVWKRIGVCTEPSARNLEWRKIDRPRDVDQLGEHLGYIWYRVEYEEERARKRYLLLPDCEDRATVFLNGQRLGVWGRGEDATRKPIGASFKRGRNILTMLVDNLGRPNHGPRFGQRKGLFGHVYDAKPLRTKKFKLKGDQPFSRRLVPRHLAHLVPELRRGPIWSAELDLPLTKVVPVQLSFADLPYHVAVLCNERPAGFFAKQRTSYGDVTLGSELKKGRNRIKLLLWGDVTAADVDRIDFYTLNETITQRAGWYCRPWREPEEGGLIVGKDCPAWYEASFKVAEGAPPLFLHVVGAKKGQIFLNGHNAGRFWNTGPQEHYYLPECWLQEVNELRLFVEDGNTPSRSKLSFRPLGPYQE